MPLSIVPSSGCFPKEYTFDALAGLSVDDYFHPFVVAQSSQVAELRQNPRVRMAMAEFGGSYTKGVVYRQSGKCQAPVLAAQGKEEVDDFLAKCVNPKFLLDISTVAGGSTFSSSTWTFGYGVEKPVATMMRDRCQP